MKKLLKLLTNAPVAIALAFLLVGAPSAPMAKMMLPSSGEAMAGAPDPDRPLHERMMDPVCDPRNPAFFQGPVCYQTPWFGMLMRTLGKILDRAVQLVAITVGTVALHTAGFFDGFFDWIGDRWDDIKDNAEEVQQSLREFCDEFDCSGVRPFEPL